MDLAWATELATGALTVVAALGFVRLFEDGSFLGPVLAAAALSHGLAVSCRRARMSANLCLVLGVAGMGLAIAWLLLPHTTRYGVPTGETIRVALQSFSTGWEQFRTVVAPAPVEQGFVLATFVAVWTVGQLADWAALRLRAPLEAVAPSFTLFVFASTLGADEHRLTWTLLYLAAALGFLAVHRAHGAADAAAWLRTPGPRAWRDLRRRAVAVGGVAVLGAALLGPELPGVDDPPVFDWRGGREGPASRVTISPLVDIRGRLVNQSDVEVFTVRADERAYWRLTSLDQFDGRIWSSRGSYEPAGGDLPRSVEVRGDTTVNVQEFEVTGLSSIWLPAAYAPRSVAGVDDVRYEAESASLITERATSDGLAYRVASARPVVDADQLAGVEAVAPGDLADRYLALPEGFGGVVAATARDVTADATTQYERALALQNFFRENFTYDLGVAAGHSAPDMERFLLTERRGYCEQFAGTYAAMARVVGLPARVAVGFTPGEPGDDGRWHVRGLNAHAWPEVYLHGHGWVAFEPTPGRGVPFGESYTGVPEQQASPTDPNRAAPVPAPEPVPAPGPDAGDPGATDAEGGIDLGAGGAGEGPDADEDDRSLVRLGLLGAAALLVAVSWLLGVPAAHWARRRRRRARAATSAEQVRLAWLEAVEALERVGVPPRPAETHREFAGRAALAAGVARGDLLVLADDAAAATYGADDPQGEVAARARRLADELAASLEAVTPSRERWAARLDPRPLLRR